MKNIFLSALLSITTIGSMSATTVVSLPYSINDDRVTNQVVENTTPINVLKIDWDKLDQIVSKDANLTDSNKTSFRMTQDIYDPIERDNAMKHAPYYEYLKTILYPKAI